ncbi:hypothetical protein DYB32_006804 [Aphanomyces invadans]|uniref:Cyclic nucleotide-binding domain-containing protein n=1 Tax=Aphanomyces invadans TaxID=157072 RepID=A0A3R6V932_9STRA|nr:hypothetical protein DYB32_006804 [Aphanomyces invadans]
MILCRIPKLLRMYKVPEIARLVKQAFAEHELLSGFHNVGMSLLAGVLLLSLALIHWATCLFLLVAHLECGFYLDQTVSGQTCWANQVQLQGAVIGAYVFLFECQNRRENDFHDQVDGVKEYLTARRLPKLLQTKVLAFYEHFWSAQRGIDEDSMIAALPTHIQTQCLDHLRAKLLKTACAGQMTEVKWDDLVAEATRIARKPIRANSKLGLGTKFADGTASALRWSHPESRFRQHWDQCMVIGLIICAVDIPLHICFDSTSSLAAWSRRFAYFENGTLISDPWFIWQQYKQHGFFLDALSIVPFTIVADSLATFVHADSIFLIVMRLCEWIRLLRIRRLLPTLAAILKHNHVKDTTTIIVNMMICVPFACHVGGCIWYWIAATHHDVHGTSAAEIPADHGSLSFTTCLEWARNDQNCTWLHYDHDHYGHPSDYVRAFYWSVVSLVTVQFGSVFPFTDAECIYMFLFLYLSIVVNFGAVGALVNAVTRINSATSKKQEQVTMAHRFMTSEGVSYHVRLHISNYYKTHWSQTSEQQALTVLQPLPDNLRQEIQSFLHEASVGYLTLFKVIDAEGLRFIYAIMKHQSYNRHEFVVRNGDACDDIYILTRGVMEGLVGVKDLYVPLQLLQPGSCIGEAAFVLKRPHEVGVRVVSESVDVSVLSRQDFASISHNFAHLWRTVESLARGLEKTQSNTIKTMVHNLQKPNIYRTLNHSPTLYIEPRFDDWLVRPDSTLYRMWELLMAVVIIYNLIQIPFRVALLPVPTDHGMLAFSIVDIVCDAIFLVDMYIKFNHLIIIDKNGDEVASLALIRANYLHGSAFKVEALASLPLYYVGNYQAMTLCRLPRLLRCLQLSSYLRSFHTFVQEQTSSVAVTQGLEFVKLFMTLVFASHLAATGLYLISHAEHGSSHPSPSDLPSHDVPSWYSHDFVIEQAHGSIGAIYLRAFYWGLGLSSFDYMDMHVSKSGETLWFCAVALTGVVFVGVIIGQVCTAIFNANKEIREVEMQLENFAFYAKMKRLPGFMVRRAKLFFQFQLDCNKGMDAHHIFRDLPQCLRLELFKDLYAKLLTPIPIFSTLNAAQINSIAERLHSKLYLPGDDVIMEGDVGNTLFIMKQGLGEKYIRAAHLIVAPVYEGSSFGEVSFFLATRHTYNVRAVKCSEILCLTKKDWTEAWSHEVSLKFKVKMAVAVQKENQLMEQIMHALKQNFGVTGLAPIKLSSVLGVKKRSTFRTKPPSVENRRDSVPNYFDFIREMSRAGPRKSPHLSQFAPKAPVTIWHAGPPRFKHWMPHSMFRNLWDMVMLAVTIYYITLVPFRACFVEIPESTPYWITMWFASEYALDVVTIADFVLRYQVFYVFAKGDIQTEAFVLRHHYRRHGPFAADLLALFPVEIAVVFLPHSNAWKLVSLCRLNRVARVVHLPHLTHSLKHILSHRKWFVAHRTLFEYIITFVAPFFVVCHWIACLWFYISFSPHADIDTPSWLVSTGYLGANTSIVIDDIPLGFSETIKFTSLNVYLASLYYAVSSLSSQSFGDMFSRNATETWLTLGIILFSVTFYGVLVGMLAEMMQDKLHPRASFEQHMVDVSTFFNYRLLPFQFFIQTSRFSRLQWQNHMGRTEDDFLSVLSTTIREDIAMFVKQNVVRNLSFLHTAEEVFVRAFVTKLETEEFIHADVIYQFGDVGRTLFFIDVGSVSLVSATTGVQTRNAHEFFGGVSLFEDVGRTVTAIANVECTMFLLHYDAFEKLVTRFPEYYDRCYTQWSVRDEDAIQKLFIPPHRATKHDSSTTKLPA